MKDIDSHDVAIILRVFVRFPLFSMSPHTVRLRQALEADGAGTSLLFGEEPAIPFASAIPFRVFLGLLFVQLRSFLGFLLFFFLACGFFHGCYPGVHSMFVPPNNRSLVVSLHVQTWGLDNDLLGEFMVWKAGWGKYYRIGWPSVRCDNTGVRVERKILPQKRLQVDISLGVVDIVRFAEEGFENSAPMPCSMVVAQPTSTALQVLNCKPWKRGDRSIELLFIVRRSKCERDFGLLPIRPALRIEEVFCGKAGRISVALFWMPAFNLCCKHIVLEVFDGSVIFRTKSITHSSNRRGQYFALCSVGRANFLNDTPQRCNCMVNRLMVGWFPWGGSKRSRRSSFEFA